MKPDKRRVSGGGRGEAGERERDRGRESERGREGKRQSARGRAGCVFSGENQMPERVEWQGTASFLNKIIDNFIPTKGEESMAKRTK